uniref:U1-nemetoxin-Csp1a n=1 Tax=Calisoga sp. TaxID=269418 RepID=CALA_CALS5|nr:RecName: Full=U1-nemetoxin-Csp1a; Short=U1-NETX-Csp1a; AltName: Full=Toxic peptide A; Flags: Precursor [Calisoga sp. US5688764]
MKYFVVFCVLIIAVAAFTSAAEDGEVFEENPLEFPKTIQKRCISARYPCSNSKDCCSGNCGTFWTCYIRKDPCSKECLAP